MVKYVFGFTVNVIFKFSLSIRLQSTTQAVVLELCRPSPLRMNIIALIRTEFRLFFY